MKPLLLILLVGDGRTMEFISLQVPNLVTVQTVI